MNPLIERIIYGFYVSDLGEILIAQTDIGVCWLGFVLDGQKRSDAVAHFKHKFPKASLLQNDTVAENLGRRVVRAWQAGRESAIDVDLRGTDFQVEVWRALRDIGRGYICSYSEVADMVMRPDAVRAVGSAIAANTVSIIVPCHRVVQKSGQLGNYAWGAILKEKLLLEEGVPRALIC
ncbi:MAG: methylated-DNA--[protein]-cysteine S-methyltransferase [Alphaproteobacteria bacterium]|nr:methylated-DNA--[protein]-cysteine S-methyltransferase [Alphaproteobacteria bacterium]